MCFIHQLQKCLIITAGVIVGFPFPSFVADNRTIGCSKAVGKKRKAYYPLLLSITTDS